jgi:hypothetical protein
MYRRECAAEASSVGCAGVQHPPPALSARQRYDLRKIRLIESNPKCRYLKKLTYKETLRQGFICLRPPPLL